MIFCGVIGFFILLFKCWSVIVVCLLKCVVMMLSGCVIMLFIVFNFVWVSVSVVLLLSLSVVIGNCWIVLCLLGVGVLVKCVSVCVVLGVLLNVWWISRLCLVR